MENVKNWKQADQSNVWHPFTQVYYAPDNIIITHGKDTCYYDDQGNSFIDAISSWWVNLHGHSHPYITKAVAEQCMQLEHSIFAGFTHHPGITLATRLLSHHTYMSKVFFSDNGSTSVEVALKMAFQYWSNNGTPKYKVIAFKEAYHGDTFGGMSVAARNAFNKPFEPLLFNVINIDLPTDENIDNLCAHLENILAEGEIASFIFEPLVLGAGGMLMYKAEHLDRLIALCNKYECITIADEVMTGFGRTGKLFASNYLHCKPDIICLSKGITGGFFPLGATLCKQEIFDAHISSDKTKTFFHGHSYTGNPTICAAANASLDLLENNDTISKIEHISYRQQQFANEIRNNSNIENVRHMGTILAFDVESNETTGYLNSKAESLADYFIKLNIILRPLGNVLYILPPYCITDAELDKIYNAIRLLIK